MTVDGNNYHQHGVDLHHLITSLALRNIALAGWSFGALSAWSYIDQFGLDRVKASVSIDMPPVPLSAGENDNAVWILSAVIKELNQPMRLSALQ